MYERKKTMTASLRVRLFQKVKQRESDRKRERNRTKHIILAHLLA